MVKSLYIICPTDYIETAVTKSFEGYHFFYTSLGDFVKLDKNSFAKLASFISLNGIKKITFILSDDNRILKEIINNKQVSKAEYFGINCSYLYGYKLYLSKHFQDHNLNKLVFSHHLNQKINELRLGLKCFLENQPLINGLLFIKKCRTFVPIYSDLICSSIKYLN